MNVCYMEKKEIWSLVVHLFFSYFEISLLIPPFVYVDFNAWFVIWDRKQKDRVMDKNTVYYANR